MPETRERPRRLRESLAISKNINNLIPKTTKQKDLMAASLNTIAPLVPAAFEEVLTAKAPTKDNPNRTLLEKHLSDYTAKNSFDYFIATVIRTASASSGIIAVIIILSIS